MGKEPKIIRFAYGQKSNGKIKGSSFKGVMTKKVQEVYRELKSSIQFCLSNHGPKQANRKITEMVIETLKKLEYDAELIDPSSEKKSSDYTDDLFSSKHYHCLNVSKYISPAFKSCQIPTVGEGLCKILWS